MSSDEIVLRLDRATAETLWTSLYSSGEHIAAGALIPRPTRDESERLGAVLRDLDHGLGRRCSPYCDHLPAA
ncbi:hypothetical protein J2S43_002833 [Catenuloplanes nepalensis]|uniref:Uncharacterized protein n=1 Tax=Catenuloplanes nepalensis TaxID=587533 RepID=A0ABT9MSB1_9ACTN|nr:hypothetical protein [Catenuloplanes nepalensis]MDP9794321.1 hypothetical protein [Catenuloplanes nepalensis]